MGPVLNAENIKADSHKILRPTHFSCTKNMEPVTKTENIKTDSTKILRPTRFLGPKNIKTDSFLSVLISQKDGE